MARAPMPAPQMIETPTMRRSAMLAKLLEEQRQPVEIKGGYGELAARLLGQGITQFGANRAERAVRDERAARTADQASAYALQLSGLGGEPPPSAAASTPTPMPTTVPMPSTPASTGPTAPVGEVMGSNLPNVGQPIPVANVPPPTPVAPVEATPQPTLENALLFGQVPAQQGPTAAPQMAAPAAPAAPQNPLAGTPGELAGIQEGLDIFRRTGDPAVGAWVNGEISRIRQRMDAPAAERLVVEDVRGVKYYIDPTGATPPTPVFGEQGVPELARTRTIVAGPNDPNGMVEGTTYQVDAAGELSTRQTPPTNYRRLRDGTLVAETGGSEDLGGNQVARFTAITGEQQRIRPLLDQATAITRNIQAVRAGVGAQNGAGDIAAVNGLQRLIDDGVVKEGDVNLQLEVQGIAGGLAGLRGYLTSSGRFSPEIRAQISGVAETLYGTQMPMIREQVMGRREFLDRSLGAGAFDDVVPPSVRQAYGWEDAPAPEGPRLTPAQAAQLPPGTSFLDMNGNRRTRR
jgi:hypothetical protein